MAYDLMLILNQHTHTLTYQCHHTCTHSNHSEIIVIIAAEHHSHPLIPMQYHNTYCKVSVPEHEMKPYYWCHGSCMHAAAHWRTTDLPSFHNKSVVVTNMQTHLWMFTLACLWNQYSSACTNTLSNLASFCGRLYYPGYLCTLKKNR